MLSAARARRAEEGSAIRRLALSLLVSAGVLFSLFVPSYLPGRAAAINGQLIAVPLAGHSGDTIYLSGGFLQANTQYSILMECPNWHDPSAFKNQNFQWVQRPDRDGNLRLFPAKTDSRGRFVKFQMTALQLHGVPSSGCTIYAATDTNPFGPEIPAQYTILAPDDRGARCLVQMCPVLTVSSRRVHAGGNEVINIDRGWPGAKATVSVKFGSPALTRQRTVTLNWEGSARAQIGVPTQAPHLSCRQVAVTAKLILGHFSHRTSNGPCFAVAR